VQGPAGVQPLDPPGGVLDGVDDVCDGGRSAPVSSLQAAFRQVTPCTTPGWVAARG